MYPKQTWLYSRRVEQWTTKKPSASGKLFSNQCLLNRCVGKERVLCAAQVRELSFVPSTSRTGERRMTHAFKCASDGLMQRISFFSCGVSSCLGVGFSRACSCQLFWRRLGASKQLHLRKVCQLLCVVRPIDACPGNPGHESTQPDSSIQRRRYAAVGASLFPLHGSRRRLRRRVSKEMIRITEVRGLSWGTLVT